MFVACIATRDPAPSYLDFQVPPFESHMLHMAIFIPMGFPMQQQQVVSGGDDDVPQMFCQALPWARVGASEDVHMERATRVSKAKPGFLREPCPLSPYR